MHTQSLSSLHYLSCINVEGGKQGTDEESWELSETKKRKEEDGWQRTTFASYRYSESMNQTNQTHSLFC